MGAFSADAAIFFGGLEVYAQTTVSPVRLVVSWQAIKSQKYNTV